jgi:Kdo2-lipid IVA lauroyltransferase/acyltransferase
MTSAPRSSAAARGLTARQRLRYGLETGAAYLAYGFFRVLPVAAASAAGGWVLSRIGPRMGISRMARRNLQRAFPGKTAQAREEILRGMWDNLGRVIGEYPHLRRIAKERVVIEGGEYFDLLRGGRGGVFISGHIANWEVCGLVALRYGVRLNLVYRKPNNPWIDGLLRYARGGDALGHITKGDKGAREMFVRLRAGESLGILMDQKLSEGMPVPFFGYPALTATAAAQFALKFDCPLIPAVVERLPGARFRVRLGAPLTVSAQEDREAAVRHILAQVNTLLETWIRARPAEWLWLHKRWPDIS